MDTNISNLEICRLAYDNKYDALKEKIDTNKEYLKQKDRVGYRECIVYSTHLIIISIFIRMVVMFFIGRAQVALILLFIIYLIHVMFNLIFPMKYDGEHMSQLTVYNKDYF
jgi:hypothetical protein